MSERFLAARADGGTATGGLGRGGTSGFRIAAGAILAGLTVWIYLATYAFDIDGRVCWGTSDDIYISACYARNLARGNGAVWYPGAPRVEGFSNPLWVAILALPHFFPRFPAALLGLFAVAVNVALACAIQFELWSIWTGGEDAPESGQTGASETGIRTKLGLLALGTANLSLPYWLASGFEVGLLGWLALLAYRTGLRSEGPAGAAAVGCLTVLGAWTRLDGTLAFIPAFGCLLLGAGPFRARARRFAIAGAIAFCGILVSFLARCAYYGEWLPNTYYLKLHGWPLAHRLAAGWNGNRHLIPTIAGAGMLLSIAGIGSANARRFATIVLPLSAFVVSWAYSVHNGGDSWGSPGGYDRFTAVGSLFLAAGLGSLLACAGERRTLVAIGAAACLILPFALAPGALRFVRNRLGGAEVVAERDWIRFGLAAAEIARPEARIAVRPAGAIVYFSERGGVDLLGKCDPYVARLPARTTGQRNAMPGHNKHDDEEMFRRHRPDLSRHRPPKTAENEYRGGIRDGLHFFLRRDSPNVLWDAVDALDKRAAPVGHTVPARLVAGRQYRFEATFRNDDSPPWRSERGFALAVVRDDAGIWAGSVPRSGLAPGEVVRPGESRAFDVWLRTPPEAGRYAIAFRMIQEQVEFFGEELVVEFETTPPAGEVPTDAP